MKNSAYFASDINLQPCIKQLLNNVESINLDNPQETADLINNDVKKITKGKITKVIEPSDLIATRFLIVNAIYFKGVWKNKFDPTRTTKIWFTDEKNMRRIGEVDLMVMKEARLKYCKYDVSLVFARQVSKYFLSKNPSVKT